ncbi:hypothetical protein TeGR_g11153 [Tetraparma gracilis]|uniref:Uncharacterized protein n=1 Tax=Tetraparma gracilis TaxID=2962635 RepID=A0ABQ6MQZ3_9STRA|nr:hypothetical protein TeGR_g11153 [Tetraparma gracilis]
MGQDIAEFAWALSERGLSEAAFKTAMMSYIDRRHPSPCAESADLGSSSSSSQIPIPSSPPSSSSMSVDESDAGSDATEESPEYRLAKRASIALGDLEGGALMHTLKTGIMHHQSLFDKLSDAQLKKLARSFVSCIKDSGDVATDVSIWFDKKMPIKLAREHKNLLANIKRLLTHIALIIRPNMKMARVGLTLKVIASTVLTYSDLVTDSMVSHAYYVLGLPGWANASISCIATSLFFQAYMTFVQYSKRGWKERYTRTLLAGAGLGPMLEGYLVWTGGNVEKKDLWMPSTVIFMSMKAFEICFESIPESVIQMSLLLSQTVGSIKSIQWISIFSTFIAGAFIQTEANLSFVRGQAVKKPNNPHVQWLPKTGRRLARCGLGLFIFSFSFFFLYVYTMSMLQCAAGSFKVLGVVVGVELGVVLAYKAWQGELLGFATLPRPSASNAIIGITTAVFFSLITCTTPMLVASDPAILGPEVFAGIILWRLASSAGVVFWAAGEIAAREGSWLTLEAALGVYGAAMVLCIGGLTYFLGNLDEGFDRGLFVRPQSGKRYVEECWDDELVWERKFGASKDYERWGWIRSCHPNLLPMEKMLLWVEELATARRAERRRVSVDAVERELRARQGTIGTWEEEGAGKRPKWLVEDKFAARIREVFRWNGNADMMRRADVALVKLFGERGGGGEGVGGGASNRRIVPA